MQNWRGFLGTLLKPALIQIQSLNENTRWFLLEEDLDGLHHHGVILAGLNYTQAPSTWKSACKRGADLETVCNFWEIVGLSFPVSDIWFWFPVSCIWFCCIFSTWAVKLMRAVIFVFVCLHVFPGVAVHWALQATGSTSSDLLCMLMSLRINIWSLFVLAI